MHAACTAQGAGRPPAGPRVVVPTVLEGGGVNAGGLHGTKLACNPQPSHDRAQEPAAASAAAAAGGSADAGAAPGDEAPPASANSSNGGSEAAGPAGAAAGTSGGLAFSLPARAMPTAGAIFCLAGVLKLLIMCFPYSTISVMMFLQGRADLGILGVAKMLPIALGLACLAKAMLDRRLHTRWVRQVGGGKPGTARCRSVMPRAVGQQVAAMTSSDAIRYLAPGRQSEHSPLGLLLSLPARCPFVWKGRVKLAAPSQARGHRNLGCCQASQHCLALDGWPLSTACPACPHGHTGCRYAAGRGRSAASCWVRWQLCYSAGGSSPGPGPASWTPCSTPCTGSTWRRWRRSSSSWTRTSGAARTCCTRPAKSTGGT